MASNEKQIRENIKEYYCNLYDDLIIKDEFTHRSLCTRSDVMLINNDLVIVIEIKSNKDTLKRVVSQITEYNSYSTLTVLVMDIVHKHNFEKKYANMDCFKSVRVMYYLDNNFIINKVGNISDYPSLFNFLWSSELKYLISHLKGKSKIKHSRIRECIEYIYDVDTLHNLSKLLFLSRIGTEYNVNYIPVLDKFTLPDIQDIFNEYLSK